MKATGSMKTKSSILSTQALMVALMAGLSVAYAQTSTADFQTQPEKSMAAAHEAFIKGDIKNACGDIAIAADYVKKQSRFMAADTKEGMDKTERELTKLRDGVEKGTVKSGDELKKTFAKADHQMAKCWHKTAQEAQKAGKDSTYALKRTGERLDGASRWSGHQLDEGTKKSLAAVESAGQGAGQGVKAGATELDQWCKSLGHGIEDLGHKL
jgi:hypothetical protein